MTVVGYPSLKLKPPLVRCFGAEPVKVDLYDSEAIRRAIAGSDAVLRLTTKIGPMAKLRDLRTWTETMRLRTSGAHILVDAAIAEGVPVYIHESVSYTPREAQIGFLRIVEPMMAGLLFCARRSTVNGKQTASRNRADECLWWVLALRGSLSQRN